MKPRPFFFLLLAVWTHVSSANAITLDAALARTLENNPSIRAAKIGVEQAAGRRLVLRSIGLPDGRLLVPAGVQGGDRAGEKDVQPFIFAHADFIQPLVRPAVPASFRRGDIEVLLAQQRLNLAVLEQLHTARLAFYAAAYNDGLRALAEAQRERLEENVRAQSDRYVAGRSERQGLLAAQVLEQEVRPRIEEAKHATSRARLALGQAMGEQSVADGKLPVVEDSLQFARVSFDVERETSTALQDRADLRLARLLVAAAREDERIVEAAYYPTIGLTVGGDYIPGDTDLRRGTQGSARRSDDVVSSEVRAGAIYSWRVIDNGRVGGAVMRQRAAREINEVVLAKMEAQVPRDLRRIQNNLRALQARHDALSKAQTLAEQTVSDVQNNLAQGLSSQLEYRTAESSSLEARTGLLAVAFEQHVTLAERDRITGRYFQFSGDTGTVH